MYTYRIYFANGDTTDVEGNDCLLNEKALTVSKGNSNVFMGYAQNIVGIEILSKEKQNGI